VAANNAENLLLLCRLYQVSGFEVQWPVLYMTSKK